MTDFERLEMRQIVLCWMRDKETAVARAWSSALVRAHWFPRLDPELVEDIACLWFSLSVEVLERRGDSYTEEFARKVRHSQVPEIDTCTTLLCFDLMKRIEYGLIDRDFDGDSRDRARLLIAENVDSFRRRYFDLAADRAMAVRLVCD